MWGFAMNHREMTMNERSQSILVSGESGAGKTETTKLLMQYLAYIGGRASQDRSVEAQVLEVRGPPLHRMLCGSHLQILMERSQPISLLV